MIFIEIRCEDSSEDWAYGEHEFMPKCYSHSNNGCGEFSDDTVSGVIIAKRYMEKHARSSGWKKIKNHGWVCPHCASNRPKTTRS